MSKPSARVKKHNYIMFVKGAPHGTAAKPKPRLQLPRDSDIKYKWQEDKDEQIEEGK